MSKGMRYGTPCARYHNETYTSSAAANPGVWEVQHAMLFCHVLTEAYVLVGNCAYPFKRPITVACAYGVRCATDLARLCRDGFVGVVGLAVGEEVVDDHSDDGEEEDNEGPKHLVRYRTVGLEDLDYSTC
jgi:rhodanese-related sulfurtransferase